MWIKRIWPFAWKSTVTLLEETLTNMGESYLRERLDKEKYSERLEEEKLALDSTRRDLAKVRSELNDANRHMTAMQATFDDMMLAKHECSDWRRPDLSWYDYCRKVLRVMEGRHAMFAVVSPPDIYIGKDAMFPSYKNVSVEKVRLGIEIGLSEECPPELIARRVGEQIEAAILKQWREQSILLAKELK